MASTKKPLKGAKPASKTSAASKKVASAKKAVSPKKAASTKSTGANLAKTAITTKVEKNGKKAAVVPMKKVSAAKLTKPATGKAISIEVAKPVAKKLNEQVKKTPADKNDTKVAAPKTVEKKAKSADVSIEKEVKPTAAKTAAVKESKPEPKVEKAPKPVVIPKTSTDKKVDYEPDFLKSVLDAPIAAPQGPTMRYSDTELQEFRDLINKKLDSAKKELAYLQGLITRRDEMGGDETDNRYMTMEDGGMSMEREQLSQMASRQITFIDHLEKALMRIENKTYGICRVTGKLIDKARLRAVPHATLSMEAKLGITK
jgi:RNA polymerase-binding transcription factor DksA